MPMDLFVAYIIEKRLRESMKKERENRERQLINITQNPKFTIKQAVIDCAMCGQNQIWCVCNYSAMD